MKPKFTCVICDGELSIDHFKEAAENKLTWWKVCKKHTEQIREGIKKNVADEKHS